MSKPKRIYSREFPKTAQQRATITADWAPPELKKAAQRKARQERVSLRTVILRHLADWTGWKAPTSSPGAGGAATR
jgi:hypothetical protein